MINNKQSSVEWLCERLALKLGTPMAISFYIDHAEEIKQAKALHKEEINDAHTTGYIIGGGNGDIYEPKQYYNEKFGGEK